MAEEQTQTLLGPDGKEIKQVTIPTVHYKDFVIPVDFVREDERVTIGPKGIRPSDIIKELRATQREMSQRFVLLATGLVAAATEGNEALLEYINTIGLKLTDYQGKSIYEPPVGPDDFIPEEPPLEP